MIYKIFTAAVLIHLYMACGKLFADAAAGAAYAKNTDPAKANPLRYALVQMLWLPAAIAILPYLYFQKGK